MGWVERNAALLVIAAGVAALVMPMSEFVVFSGLPLCAPVELIGLVLVIPLVSPSVRANFVRWLDGANLSKFAAIGAASVLVIKLALLVIGVEHGYRACFASSDPRSPR